jgi:hypothetical protein
VNDATESRVFEVCESVVEKKKRNDSFLVGILVWILFMLVGYMYSQFINLTSCLDS